MSAAKLLDELGNLLPDDMVFGFPVDATIATQTAIASPDELSQRLQTLEFLAEKRAGIVVVTPQALQYKLSDPRDFTKAKKIFKPEAEFDLDKLTEWLTQAGYRRESIVVRPGEFARRGDILDIYPLDQENPIRIELLCDENTRSRAGPIEILSFSSKLRCVAESNSFTVSTSSPNNSIRIGFS